MVMDVYDHLPPSGPPKDQIYLLAKVCDDVVYVLGCFDYLETALHALNHLAQFQGNKLKEGDRYLVSRQARNTLRRSRRPVMEWIRDDGEARPGCPNGRFRVLDEGTRTHDID